MLEIRNATPDDLDAITRLWRAMMDLQLTLNDHFTLTADAEPCFRDAATQKLVNPEAINLVAVQEDRVIGFCFSRIQPFANIYTKDRYCLISDLSVDPQARRNGVAAKLLDAVKAWCIEQGVVHYEVNVAQGNTAAEKFWEKAGFQVLTRKYIL